MSWPPADRMTTHVDVSTGDDYRIECNYVRFGDSEFSGSVSRASWGDGFHTFTITAKGLFIADLGAGSPGYSGHALWTRNGRTVCLGWVSGTQIPESYPRPIKWWDENDKPIRYAVESLTVGLDSMTLNDDSTLWDECDDDGTPKAFAIALNEENLESAAALVDALRLWNFA